LKLLWSSTGTFKFKRFILSLSGLAVFLTPSLE
jgi:hypothetical protein